MKDAAREKPPLPLAGEGRGEGTEPDRVHHKQSTITARELRQNQTEAERIVWNALKAKRFEGLKFKRQFPIGPFFADFVCIEEKLVIEIDGGQHCENARDNSRTAYLNHEGFEVVRFWNNDVLDNLDGVLSSLSLTLSRKRERGQSQNNMESLS